MTHDVQADNPWSIEEARAAADAIRLEVRGLLPPFEWKDGVQALDFHRRLTVAFEEGDVEGMRAIIDGMRVWLPEQRERREREWQAERERIARRESRLIRPGRLYREGAIVGGESYGEHYIDDPGR